LGCRSRYDNGFDKEDGRGRNLEGRGTGGKITNGIIVRKKEIIYLMICEELCTICSTVHRRLGARVLATWTPVIGKYYEAFVNVYFMSEGRSLNHRLLLLVELTERNVCVLFIVG
jgi:hypothetical protein